MSGRSTVGEEKQRGQRMGKVKSLGKIKEKRPPTTQHHHHRQEGIHACTIYLSKTIFSKLASPCEALVSDALGRLRLKHLHVPDILLAIASLKTTALRPQKGTSKQSPKGAFKRSQDIDDTLVSFSFSFSFSFHSFSSR
jgi:hypothetical protein